MCAGLQVAPELAAHVTKPLLERIFQLSSVSGHIAYKVAFFIYCYLETMFWNTRAFLEAGGLRHIKTLVQDYEGEIRGWMVFSMSSLVQRAYGLRMGDIGRAMFDVEQRHLVTTILQTILRATQARVNLLCGVTIETAVLWIVFTFEAVEEHAAAAMVINLLPESILMRAQLSAFNNPAQICSASQSIARAKGMHALLLKLGPFFNVVFGEEASETAASILPCITSVWRGFMARDERSAPVAVLIETDFVDLLIQACHSQLPDSDEPHALLVQGANDGLPESSAFCEAVAECGGIPAVVDAMRSSNKRFALGSRLLVKALKSSSAHLRGIVVQDAGLSVLLEVLSTSKDALLQNTISSVLPTAFKDPAMCAMVANTGVVSHLVALVETSVSNLEMSTALHIIANLLQHSVSASSFISHGGLRVLVDVYCMQCFAAYDTERAPDTVHIDSCLEKALLFGVSHTDVMGQDGAIASVVKLLEGHACTNITLAALKLLLAASTDVCAHEVMDAPMGIASIAHYFVSVNDDHDRQYAQLAYRMIVDLAFNANAVPRGLTQYQALVRRLLPAVTSSSVWWGSFFVW